MAKTKKTPSSSSGKASSKKSTATTASATLTQNTRSLSRNDELPPLPPLRKNKNHLPTVSSRKDTKIKAHDSKKEEECVEEKKSLAKAARPKNFDVAKEDLYLCQAYVNVSTDPTIGNNQKGDVFWNKVASKFAELRKADSDFDGWPERDGSAVMNRFKRQIQKNTLLYNSYYARVKAKNKSGTNEVDYIQQAASDFLEAKGRPFPWTHCIEVLHKIPKLDPNMPDLTGDDSDDEKINKIGAPMGAGKKRPQGSKAAKAASKGAKKKAKLDAYSVASMETQKTNSMEAVGLASMRMADSSEFKTMQESMMEEAKMYISMGMQTDAVELMEKVKAN